MLTWYPEGSLVLPSDNELRTLHKLAFLNGGGTGTGSGTGGGGSSGSGAVQLYTDRDPSAPADPSLTAASFNSSTQVITWWPAGGSAWQ